MKVSVAIMTYNHEKYIADAIEGALMQNVDFPYEIVIGEDCSLDRTRDLVRDYKIRYPDKIRLRLQEKNVGPRRNLAELLGACRGEYIAYIDGDDYWTSPKKLQSQADFLDSHPECSSCFHSVIRIFEDGSQDVAYPPGKKEIYTLEDLWLNPTLLHFGATMFRRGIFGDLPSWFFNGEIYFGDWTIHVLNAEHGKIGYLDGVMGAYRKHSGGIYSGHGPFAQVSRDMKTRSYVNEQLGFKYNKLMKRFFTLRYFQLARLYYENGERRKSISSLVKSVSTSPFNRHFSTKRLISLTFQLYLPQLFLCLRSLRQKVLGNP